MTEFWTAMETATFLIVPGWNGSGPGHWQTIWERRKNNFRRVEQNNWNRPSRKQWVEAIEKAVQEEHAPVFVVAHSLGCLAVARWAENGASILAASEDDPYLPIEIAPRLARAWGSKFENLGRQGHINVASGHGEWAQGERLLEQLTRQTGEKTNYGAVAKW
jgi:predicted alpha/beta hydrolase family esterase